MNIQPIDTLTAQQKALESCSEEIFITQVMEPLEDLWKPFMGRFPQDTDAHPALSAATMMGYYTPEDGCKAGLEALQTFEEADSWQACVRAAEGALELLNSAAHGVEIDPIQFTLVLGSLRSLDLAYGAYTGVQQPGIAVVTGYPNPLGTPRLPVASAHEIHHIVRFAYEPFMPDLTLGKYIVAEGLAEAFGLEVVGDASLVGPYCTALTPEEVESVKPRFRDAVNESDFGVVRGYVFGDWAAEQFHYPKQGVPDFAGYTLGYELVRAFLERTGTSIVEASYLPWQEIVEGSGYFGT